MPRHLFLFDIDCTLLYTYGAGREAVRLALHEVFGTVGALDGFVFSGKTDAFTLRQILANEAFSDNELTARGDAYREALTRHIGAVIPRFEVKALPGALDLVQRLRAEGALLGIVTGNIAGSAHIKLRVAGFDPAWFPIGAYGHESADRDDLPPLALARAIEYYQQPILPQDVIVIGDTPMDVACARALGAVAVAVDTGFEGREALIASQPDFLLDDLTQFDRVLVALAQG